MRVLIVTATAAEVAPLLHLEHRHHVVDVLTTGVGMVSTAARCAQRLARERYDLALNVGVCGSFDPSLPPGTVVHVVADRIAELGAEDGHAFLTIHDLELLGEDEFPFTGGQLVNASPPQIPALHRLRDVTAITVNTAHGDDRSIAAAVERFHPHVESMEGAAFMYACLINELPFAQVRAVSNVVERRNRGAWRLNDAIEHLNAATVEILDSL